MEGRVGAAYAACSECLTEAIITMKTTTRWHHALTVMMKATMILMMMMMAAATTRGLLQATRLRAGAPASAHAGAGALWTIALARLIHELAR